MNSAGISVLTSEPEWDEAFIRVESYLRALHVDSRVLLNRLATDMLVEARGVALTRSDPPVTIAMEIARERLDAWFAQVAKNETAADERFRVRGRLALVMADTNGDWARYFLSGEAVPPAFAEAMSHAALQAGPEVRFSNMPPAPLEFEAERESQPIKPAIRWVLMRGAGVWIAIFALMGMAWAASH